MGNNKIAGVDLEVLGVEAGERLVRGNVECLILILSPPSALQPFLNHWGGLTMSSVANANYPRTELREVYRGAEVTTMYVTFSLCSYTSHSSRSL